jgi:hypothetical protein
MNACCISALQGKLLPPDKGKTTAPEATFFVFLFHLFTTYVTRALPLGTIKGEAGATSKDN